ncbi:MAG: hypothetical protein ACYS83_04595 [Planctomycetota bacterium]|jgi:hypothetical protein
MNRRQFIRKSGLGVLALGLTGSTVVHALSDGTAKKQIEWSIKPKKWKSLGSLDLIPQIDQAVQWTNQSLIKYGVAWRPGGCCMRAACMPAEACAHYYAMTGDDMTIKAIKAAVRTFRKYRHRARGRRMPYEEIKGPVKLDFVNGPQTGRVSGYTIQYETISCHVGRNMRGMRAAAHVLQDEQLLKEAAEELNWWIDNPLGFNREKHFFDARIFLDENGKTIGCERKYTLNMGGSLACAMWLVGNDLGDRRLMEYGEDQILNGIAPYQLDNGYFPYNTTHKYQLVDDIALDSNYYHGLTLQVLSPLLAYERWQRKLKFVEMIGRGAKYIRDKLTFEDGRCNHPKHIDALREKRLNLKPKPPWGLTVNSAYIHTMIYKYLGGAEAFSQAAKNLRWLHFNSPTGIPFLPGIGEGGISHNFRQVVLMAWEGMHLKRKGTDDVEAVFIE